MDDDFVKKRLERDLADLKRMCDDHFKKREEDDSVVTDLEKRIADRQTVSLKDHWKNAKYIVSLFHDQMENLSFSRNLFCIFPFSLSQGSVVKFDRPHDIII